jgi:hypothetical protein
MTVTPILFKAPMVRALIEGRKTTTRRILSKRNTLFNGRPWEKTAPKFEDCDWANAWIDDGPSPAGNAGPYLKVKWPYGKMETPQTEETLVARIYPKYQVGDLLWVKEAWRAESSMMDHIPPSRISKAAQIIYEANGSFGKDITVGKLRPSMFMCQWMSRITLEVTAVKGERLNDISEDDAMAEGIVAVDNGFHWLPDTTSQIWATLRYRTVSSAFSDLWESINGEGSWAANPLVVAPIFKVHKCNVSEMI